MTAITINKLEKILNKLIENLDKKGVTTIAFDEDLYWNVPTDVMSDFPKQPELTIGSLIDDISFLESLVDEDYTTDFLELERLASLFKFIAKHKMKL